jgi:glycosyltransferase involved in cell wall biosynthesis
VADEPPARPAGRLAVVGISVNVNCGVHDQARKLTDALEADGLPCSFHWLRRRARTPRGALAEVGAWRRELERELAAQPPRATMLHFSFSYRGLPVFTAPVLRSLRRAGAPIIAELHEAAYPFGLGGARGLVWASTQRVALAALMRGVSGAIVTADYRAAWLTGSRWLPARRVLAAPVFSNLPPPSGEALAAHAAEPLIGVFGYSYEGTASELTLDAVARLRAAGVPARLRLMGAPGPSSASGERWTREAGERGLDDVLTFSGALPAQQLSDELAACAVLLFPDVSGPDSRKSTLAAALVSGAPVVALDGHNTWPALRAAGAARVVAPTVDALAGTLGELLGDARERRELGALGRAFAEREMSPATVVRAVRELLAGESSGAQPRGSRSQRSRAVR